MAGDVRTEQGPPAGKELFNPEQDARICTIRLPVAGIPLEAQRLGLEAYASDLNPVAVLSTRR